jgi:hypothetical protein
MIGEEAELVESTFKERGAGEAMDETGVSAGCLVAGEPVKLEEGFRGPAILDWFSSAIWS